MKRIAIVLLSCVALLAGCATNDKFYAMQEKLLEQLKEIKLKDAELKLEQQRTRTAFMANVGPRIDASGAAAIGVAMQLAGGSSTPTADPATDLLKMVALQKPPESWDDKALKWAAVLIPGLTQGAQIFASRDVSMAQISGNTRVQEAMMSMIAQINRDTGNAVRDAGNRPAGPPTYQITVNGDGNGLFGGSGDASQVNITCSSSTGPGGAGGPGAPGGTATGTTGGAGGAGAQSGSPPVTCTVTR